MPGGMSFLRSSEVNFEAQAVGSHTSCLSWRLGPDSAFSIELEQLQDLHAQINTHLTVFRAVLLFDDATSGLIMGNGVEDAGMNAPDSMTRLGQLLCRWALSQSPAIGILVGVDHGVLYSVQGLLSFPSGNESPAYFGPVSAGARHLADTSRQEGICQGAAERPKVSTAGARKPEYLLPGCFHRGHRPCCRRSHGGAAPGEQHGIRPGRRQGETHVF